LFVWKCLLAIILGGLCGCSNWPLSSKWAMDDVDYATKYSQPYGDDKPVRMLKQMFDARHVKEKTGAFVGGGGGGSPSTGGVSVGSFYYPNYWTEVDLGLTGLAGTGAHDWFIGPEAGVRFQTPTRIAPFAGAGHFSAGIDSVPARTVTGETTTTTDRSMSSANEELGTKPSQPSSRKWVFTHGSTARPD
jgi:hypothetical protein